MFLLPQRLKPACFWISNPCTAEAVLHSCMPSIKPNTEHGKSLRCDLPHHSVAASVTRSSGGGSRSIHIAAGVEHHVAIRIRAVAAAGEFIEEGIAPRAVRVGGKLEHCAAAVASVTIVTRIGNGGAVEITSGVHHQAGSRSITSV